MSTESPSPNPSETYSLRPATEDDIPELFRVESAAQASGWTEEHFRAEFNKPYSRILVLTDDETDEKVAGFIVYWIMFRECQILDVAVDPTFQRRGFGRKLVKAVVSQALKQEITKILLEVRKGNVPAQQLYQNCEFVVTHVRKKFYSDGEDAYEMALYLADSVPSSEIGF